MVSVVYTHRLICDCEFIRWILEQEDKHSLFSKLMHIKGSSEQWKKHHNLLLLSEFKKNKDIISIEEESIGAIFKISEDPQFLQNYKEQITKNLIFSIDLTDERPFKCYILTSPDYEKKYRENTHYDRITSVEIISGERARMVIKDFFTAFEIERQSLR